MMRKSRLITHVNFEFIFTVAEFTGKEKDRKMFNFYNFETQTKMQYAV